jgi:hypothetical protein
MSYCLGENVENVSYQQLVCTVEYLEVECALHTVRIEQMLVEYLGENGKGSRNTNKELA